MYKQIAFFKMKFHGNTGTHIHFHFIYGCVMLQEQSWVAWQRLPCSQPQIFILWPIKEKFAHPVLKD